MIESIAWSEYVRLIKNPNIEKIRELRRVSGLTLKEIGAQFNMTGQRVSQICKGIPAPVLQRDSITKFISAESLTSCWIWIGNKDHGGYGHIKRNRSERVAHRYIYELMIGKIPDGFFACHRCDNPACVNPDHIFIGTPLDNTRDMIQKGRERHVKKH